MHFRKKTIKYEVPTNPDDIFEVILLRSNGNGKTPIADLIALKDAYEKLPNGYKEALTLHDIFGYTHDEIAVMKGCSAGTNKSQTFKARKKMRNLLSATVDPTQPVFP